MTSPNQAALDQSLSDAEYDRLEAILRGLPGESAMNLEEMDGFFAALICGPVAVPLSAHLDEIWGGGPGPFATEAELREFLNLATRHWNLIARALVTPDLVFIPRLVPKEDEKIPRGNRWARGFLRGVGLCRKAWDEIFDHEDRFAILLPVLALAHENDPDPELRSWKTPPGPELRKEVLAGLTVATQSLWDYFRPGGSSRTSVRAPATRSKIGRNDPAIAVPGRSTNAAAAASPCTERPPALRKVVRSESGTLSHLNVCRAWHPGHYAGARISSFGK